MRLQSPYRIAIKGGITNLPEFSDFIEYLKGKFKELTQFRLNLGLSISEPDSVKYTFTVVDVPNTFSPVVDQIAASVNSDSPDPKLVEARNLLMQLDPMEPKPVEIEITLAEILSFVYSHVGYFEFTLDGVVHHYFGINDEAWFEFYPILAVDVLNRVDFGNWQSKQLHLFDWVFDELRENFLDYYISYQNLQRVVRVANADGVTNTDANI